MKINFSLDTLSFILGMFSTVIFPFFIWIHNKISKKIRINKFKKLLYKEYVLKINLKDLTTASKFCHESIKRLRFLNQEELVYYNNGIQFELIRSVEYTILFFGSMVDILDSYEFRDTVKVTLEVIQAEEEEKLKKINNLTEFYLKTMDDYIKLKRDRLG